MRMNYTGRMTCRPSDDGMATCLGMSRALVHGAGARGMLRLIVSYVNRPKVLPIPSSDCSDSIAML